MRTLLGGGHVAGSEEEDMYYLVLTEDMYYLVLTDVCIRESSKLKGQCFSPIISHKGWHTRGVLSHAHATQMNMGKRSIIILLY